MSTEIHACDRQTSRQTDGFIGYTSDALCTSCAMLTASKWEVKRDETGRGNVPSLRRLLSGQ